MSLSIKFSVLNVFVLRMKCSCFLEDSLKLCFTSSYFYSHVLLSFLSLHPFPMLLLDWNSIDTFLLTFQIYFSFGTIFRVESLSLFLCNVFLYLNSFSFPSLLSAINICTHCGHLCWCCFSEPPGISGPAHSISS